MLYTIKANFNMLALYIIHGGMAHLDYMRIKLSVDIYKHWV